MDPFNRSTYSAPSKYDSVEDVAVPYPPTVPPPAADPVAVVSPAEHGHLHAAALLAFLETLETADGYHLTHEEALALAAQVWRSA